MNFEFLEETFAVIRKNKLRTVLTFFGVFWGILFLIIMLGSGNGLNNSILRDLGDFATNSAFFWSRITSISHKGYNSGRTIEFTYDDVEALKNQIPDIETIAARLQKGNWRNGIEVSSGNRSGDFVILGDEPEYRLIDPLEIVNGRFINRLDIAGKRKVAVIGIEVSKILFDSDCIGKYFNLNGVQFCVVGVFEQNSKVNEVGDSGMNIIIPLTSMQQIFGEENKVASIFIASKNLIPVSNVELQVISVLFKRHNIHPDDKVAIAHHNVEEQFQRVNSLFIGINLLVWFIGLISLLSGIIGIGNILSATIIERKKEIGIKRAIGATPGSILRHILFEAVFLTSIAGLAGMVTGLWLLNLMKKIATSTDNNMFVNPSVSLPVVITSLFIIVGMGVFAGIIPAIKAVKIKPIEALRHE